MGAGGREEERKGVMSTTREDERISFTYSRKGGEGGLWLLLDHIYRLTVTVHEPDAQTRAAP